MDYLQAKEFFDSLLRFGVRPGLGSIRRLTAELGSPQDGLKFIHVAGTNGKGSVCAELASVFRAAGYRTGLYTSPYVTDFRERFIIDGELVPQDVLARAAQKVKTAVDRLSEQGIVITEFEAITAAAFIIFSESSCDVVVLETGLGGRFDATNIIGSPLASVITSISMDHMAILGDTPAKIAREKAGIIKPGRPVVTYDCQMPEVLEVIRDRANELGSELVLVPTGYIEFLSDSITGSVIRSGGLELSVPFPGKHQAQNACLAAAAACTAGQNGFNISDSDIVKGIAAAFLPARTEIISSEPPVILDGAHNDGATKALAEVLGRYLPGRRILALMGMMKDKDTDTALKNLAGCFAYVITARPANPRSEDAAALLETARVHGFEGESAASPEAAVKRARELLPEYDALVVCGSFYLAAQVRGLLRECFPAG